MLLCVVIPVTATPSPYTQLGVLINPMPCPLARAVAAVTHCTPRDAMRRSTYGAVAFLGASLVWLALWASPVLPDSRMTLALYITLLHAGVACTAVAMLAGTQLAIHQAFHAGFRTGAVAHMDPLEHAEAQARRGERDPLLTLVDDKRANRTT